MTKLSADRLLVGNTIIAIVAIVKADYSPTSRKLTVVLSDSTEINLMNDEAESTWDYLRSVVYGCIEPLKAAISVNFLMICKLGNSQKTAHIKVDIVNN